jgi:hypothetical protein
MANWGGKRPGSGRKPGSVNKICQAAREAALKSGQNPVEFLLEVMRNESLPLGTRLDAAKAAAPYLHARLANTEISGPDGGGITFVISETDSQL